MNTTNTIDSSGEEKLINFHASFNTQDELVSQEELRELEYHFSQDFEPDDGPAYVNSTEFIVNVNSNDFNRKDEEDTLMKIENAQNYDEWDRFFISSQPVSQDLHHASSWPIISESNNASNSENLDESVLLDKEIQFLRSEANAQDFLDDDSESSNEIFGAWFFYLFFIFLRASLACERIFIF